MVDYIVLRVSTVVHNNSTKTKSKYIDFQVLIEFVFTLS